MKTTGPRVNSRQRADRAAELWAKGLTVSQIALRLGATVNNINVMLHHRGIERSRSNKRMLVNIGNGEESLARHTKVKPTWEPGDE